MLLYSFAFSFRFPYHISFVKCKWCLFRGDCTVHWHVLFATVWVPWNVIGLTDAVVSVKWYCWPCTNRAPHVCVFISLRGDSEPILIDDALFFMFCVVHSVFLIAKRKRRKTNCADSSSQQSIEERKWYVNVIQLLFCVSFVLFPLAVIKSNDIS